MVNHCILGTTASKQLWRWKFIWANGISSELDSGDPRCRRTQGTGQFSVFQLSVSLSTEAIGGKRQNANYEFLIYCQKVSGISKNCGFSVCQVRNGKSDLIRDAWTSLVTLFKCFVLFLSNEAHDKQKACFFFFFNFAAVSSPSFCFSLCRSPSSPPLRPTPPLPPSPWSHWFALGDVHISSGAFLYPTDVDGTQLFAKRSSVRQLRGGGRWFFFFIY